MPPQHARGPLWRDQTPEEKLEALHRLTLDLYAYQFCQARAAILAQLAAHKPADDEEKHDIARIKTLVEAHPNILSMNCEVGHITGSAVIIELKYGRALLHYHKRLRRWLQVGGHADYETDFAQVALREAREETGLPDLRHWPPSDAPIPLDYDAHTIPPSGDMREHLHLDFRFLLVTDQPQALAPTPGESAQFRWLSRAEAMDRGAPIDSALRRLLGKAFAALAGNC